MGTGTLAFAIAGSQVWRTFELGRIASFYSDSLDCLIRGDTDRQSLHFHLSVFLLAAERRGGIADCRRAGLDPGVLWKVHGVEIGRGRMRRRRHHYNPAERATRRGRK